MATMAGGSAAEENTGESNVCMPNGFPEGVEPRPQSVAGVERSQYKAAWRKAMKIELDVHKTTGTKLRLRREGGNLLVQNGYSRTRLTMMIS